MHIRWTGLKFGPYGRKARMESLRPSFCIVVHFMFAGEGTLAIGKKYIIAAIVVSVFILVLIISAVVGYKKYGDDVKQEIEKRKKKRNNRTDADSDSEAIPLPPYSRNDPSMYSLFPFFFVKSFHMI